MREYNQIGNLDQTHPLTEDELRRVVPSIFATTAHASRSERYAPISTIEVVRGLAKEGFGVFSAAQSVTRNASKVPYTKHMLRIRKLGELRSVAGSVFEILLKNANDGSSRYDLMAGIFRFICFNGMICGSTIDAVKVRHFGNVKDKVIDGTFRVLSESEQVLSVVDQWTQIRLEKEEQLILAKGAHLLRFGDAEGNVTTPITPEQLLISHRHQDDANDLFTTFNVIQENVIRGGLSGLGRGSNGRPRRTTTRAIKGIDQDVKLNKGLWLLGTEMAKLKQAA